ncbi:hypothetical protein [Roseibium sp.]|uniref:hypothetical protein n=1 Tax=Roseibium sp. TaxID=1936156 RepID=UPI003B50FA4A
MTKLSSDAQLALDKYLENRDKRIDEYLDRKDRRLAVFSVSAILSVVGIVSAFFVYVRDDARNQAVIQSQMQFDAYRTLLQSDFDNQAALAEERLQRQLGRLETIRSEILEERLELRTSINRSRDVEERVNVLAREVDDLKADVEAAVDGIRNAEQSFGYAQEILGMQKLLYDAGIIRPTVSVGETTGGESLNDLGFSE